jgi:hypothetical protein
LLVTAVPASHAEDDAQTPPPFSFSGIAAEGRHQSTTAAPAPSAAAFPPAGASSATAAAGACVNLIGSNDVTQLGTVGGVAANTCNPGKQTAQNETPIAVNPADAQNLVAGANDYRLYEPSENRYDGSGGFYRSTDGGTTWTAGFLPGLVRANGGDYESAGDPAIAAGPGSTFWYANLAFNRSDNANAVAASRSTDGGVTWSTNFILQTSAAQGATLFNDKEWIGADPNNANVAYVTWTQFKSSRSGRTLSSPIVISKTSDGGATWSAPKTFSSFSRSQGSVVQVDSNGWVHVTFETFSKGKDIAAYAVSKDGGATWTTKSLGTINDIPSPLPGALYRTNSFPAFALDGSSLHVVWSNWNGTDADVVYTRSSDGGTTWSAPVTVGGSSGDQLFPWVATSGGKVFASWYDRTAQTNSYGVEAAASSDGGATWTAPVAIAPTANVDLGNTFGYPNCSADFIGDYSGITAGSDGVAHVMWSDVRLGNDVGNTADQDPYTATLSVS